MLAERPQPVWAAAHTRRQRRERQWAADNGQPAAESPTQAHVARRSRPRVHPDMLTVAIQGPLAARMRELAESTSLSLAKLLQDSILVYGGQVEAGYEPGTSLADWTAQQRA